MRRGAAARRARSRPRSRPLIRRRPRSSHRSVERFSRLGCGEPSRDRPRRSSHGTERAGIGASCVRRVSRTSRTHLLDSSDRRGTGIAPPYGVASSGSVAECAAAAARRRARLRRHDALRALTPLLPTSRRARLSKTRAGALVAAYAAGALVGGLPGGFAAARLGARRAVLVGLTGDGPRERRLRARGQLLDALRRAPAPGLRQRVHVGGRVRLAARRGAARPARRSCIGSAMGAAVFGALFGPVIGAAAALAGRDADLLRARGARRSSSSCGRCGSAARRPASSRRPRRSCARFATGSSPAGSR